MYLRLTSSQLDEMYIDIEENPTLILSLADEDQDYYTVTYYTHGNMLVIYTGNYLECKTWFDNLVNTLDLKFKETD